MALIFALVSSLSRRPVLASLCLTRVAVEVCRRAFVVLWRCAGGHLWCCGGVQEDICGGGVLALVDVCDCLLFVIVLLLR